MSKFMDETSLAYLWKKIS